MRALWKFGVLLCLATPAFAAKPKLARTLPSEVKHVKVRTVRPKAKARRAEAMDPSTSRYLTRKVFFWHSTDPLPRSYRCDEDLSEAKKEQAEVEAMDRCQASGVENCSVKEVKIVKNGALRCADIPGGCLKRHHYAGCVAVAEVRGVRE